MIAFIVVYVFFCALVGVLASRFGRDIIGWMLLAMLISPLLAGLLLLVLGSLRPREGGSAPKTHTKCPACAESVLREASKCKHCGSALTPTPWMGG